MSEPESADRIAAAVAALVPPLTERLNRHHLGELEVQRGDIRVRVVAGGQAPAGERGSRPSATSAPAKATAEAGGAPAVLRAPAVGYFIAAEGLAEGSAFVAGAIVGHIEMLGVPHEVRADGPGTVRRLAVESGQAVEYGQVLVEIRPTA
jgi:biotin carboxyl carrier protein